MKPSDATQGITMMLPFPPVIAATLAAIGVVALSRMLAREWQRVNEQLNARDRATVAVRTRDLPTLRRDPVTGVYRPE
jgi:Flp pilus assembly protein CpaB